MSRCLRWMGLLLWASVFVLSSENSYAFGWDSKSDDDLIPDNIVALAEGETTNRVIIVEKSSQRLMLYSYDGDYHKVLSFECSTGEVAGAKTRTGDKKTPEGVYFFIQEHEKKYLSAVYGDRAFPMDYPNAVDRQNEYDGNSIWMHGTNKPIKPMTSNGCVVLDNKDINVLTPYVTLNRTPIIVVEKINYVRPEGNQGLKERLVAFIRDWHKVMTSGSYQEYLDFYDPEYVPDISWWPAWLQAQKKLAASGTLLFVNMHRPILLKDKDICVALFDQTANVGEKKLAVGTRKLFISSKNNRFAIVGDEFQPQPTEPKIPKPDYPLVAALQEQKTLFASIREPKAMIPAAQEQKIQPEGNGKELKPPPPAAKDLKPIPATQEPKPTKEIAVKEQKTPLVASQEAKSAASPVRSQKPMTSQEQKPVAAAPKETKTRPDSKQEIAALVEDWLKAWSAKEIERYGSYYSPGFQADGMNLSAWLKHKKQLSRQYDYIKVSKKDLEIAVGEETGTAGFVQVYESSGYKAVGRKKLILKRENGKWKILRETWKRI